MSENGPFSLTFSSKINNVVLYDYLQRSHDTQHNDTQHNDTQDTCEKCYCDQPFVSETVRCVSNDFM
jgi:hypothetical protein